jgi:hypothetical protein
VKSRLKSGIVYNGVLLVSENVKLIEPATAMRPGDFKLRVTGLVIVVALAGPPNERKIISCVHA